MIKIVNVTQSSSSSTSQIKPYITYFHVREKILIKMPARHSFVY